jgi:hypothetical protein
MNATYRNSSLRTNALQHVPKIGTSPYIEGVPGVEVLDRLVGYAYQSCVQALFPMNLNKYMYEFVVTRLNPV